MIALVLGLVACSTSVPTDDSVAQAIQAKFYSHPQLKSEPIQVSVAKGEATLSGSVSGEEARLRAFKMASETQGVTKVIDSMQVADAAAQPENKAAEPEPIAATPAKAENPAPAAEPPKPASPKIATIPAGTNIRVQMIDSIDSKTSQPGLLFQASLYSPLTAGEQVAVPKGAEVYVKVINAKAAGNVKGSSELEVALDHLVFQGKSIPLVSSSVKEVGDSRGKQTAKRTVVGGGVGALIGGIAGGGKGAAIGAAVGGGGALAYQALTHGKEVKIPSETKLDFVLGEALTVTLPPKPAK
jgi:hypothetical protein